MADAAILHGALERIGWSIESRNAFTNEGFHSIQSLSHVTWLHLKTVCKSIRSAPDPVRIGFYQEYKLYALHLWVTTWLSQGQMVQGQQFTEAIALEYASKVCHLKESKKRGWGRIGEVSRSIWKGDKLEDVRKGFKELPRNEERDQRCPIGIHNARRGWAWTGRNTICYIAWASCRDNPTRGRGFWSR